MQKLMSYWPCGLLILILLVALLLGGRAISTSPVETEEVDILAASYNYWHSGQYQLLPEVFPLAKLWLSVPAYINSFALDASTLPTVKIARWLNLAVWFFLLIAGYFVSKSLVGCAWALWPTLWLTFLPMVWQPNSYIRGSPFEALILFLAISWWPIFLLKPTRKNLIIAAILLGLSLTVSSFGLWLLPILLFVAAAYVLAQCGYIWENADPTFRFNQCWAKIIFYGRRTLTAVFFGLALVYSLHIPASLVDRPPISASTASFSSEMIVGWLADNAALRPLAWYIFELKNVDLASAGPSEPQNSIPKEQNGPSLPLLVLIGLSLFWGLGDLFKNLINNWRRRTTPLLDYISLRLTEFSGWLSLLMLLVLFSLGLNRNFGVVALAISLAVILMSGIIKRQFFSEGDWLAKDVSVKIKIFDGKIFVFSAKTFLLIGLTAWQVFLGL